MGLPLLLVYSRGVDAFQTEISNYLLLCKQNIFFSSIREKSVLLFILNSYLQKVEHIFIQKKAIFSKNKKMEHLKSTPKVTRKKHYDFGWKKNYTLKKCHN